MSCVEFILRTLQQQSVQEVKKGKLFFTSWTAHQQMQQFVAESGTNFLLNWDKWQSFYWICKYFPTVLLETTITVITERYIMVALRFWLEHDIFRQKLYYFQTNWPPTECASHAQNTIILGDECKNAHGKSSWRSP